MLNFWSTLGNFVTSIQVRQSLDSRKQHSTRDVDDSFQKERDWANLYGVQLKDACDKFQHVINSQLRLANQISHLATSLNASIGGNEGSNAFYNRLNSRSVCIKCVAFLSLSVGNYSYTPRFFSRKFVDFLAVWKRRESPWSSPLLMRTSLWAPTLTSGPATWSLKTRCC